jgi:3-keto-5-aminohexanoate cleavage enzyme
MSSPLIISAALTGTRRSDRNPHVPMTPEAIGEDAIAAWRAGAAIVHIHARDDRGDSTWEAEYFRRTLEVIRGAGCDVLVNLTTSWGGTRTDTRDEQRFAPLELRPDLASLDCGSMNFGDNVFHNSPSFLRALAARMRDADVKPELEVFDAGMVGNALRLADEGLLKPPLFVQLVLGVAGGAPATPRQLVHLVDMLPSDVIWSVCAIGRAQLPINVLGAALGGHVRTGLEDNLWFGKGDPADNPRLVGRQAELAAHLDRRPATPDEARALLGLTQAVAA